MRFSVIIPVYNVEAYLKQCVESVLAQTFTDYELLLVDDGSTDTSGEICDSYSAQDSRVRVLHQQNAGQSSARNAALDIAKGEWIAFVDSDDWIHPEMLQKLNREIERKPADLYCFNAQKVSESGEALEKLLFFVEYDTISFRREQELVQFFERRFLNYSTGWEVWSRIFRRDVIEQHQIRFQPISRVFAEDMLFSAQYLIYTKQIGMLCDLFYYYRQRGNSTVHMQNQETVLPRMYHLAEYFYELLRSEHRKQLLKSFGLFYFDLMNFQIQFSLENVPDVQIEQYLQQLEQYPLHRKWLEAARVKTDGVGKDMVIHAWL